MTDTPLKAGEAASRGLGPMAYYAYGEATDFKNFLGDPMPTWEQLGELQKQAWLRAVAAVEDYVRIDITRRLHEGLLRVIDELS